MAMQKTVNINMTMAEELWPYQVVDEIQNVMEKGERDGKRGWDKRSVDEHMTRATAHISLWAYGCTDEDHLAHAFTRLMMAIAIQRGYVEEDTNA